jgi:phosphonoacetaldehyde hydrolase
MYSLPQTQSIKAIIFDWAGTTIDFGSLAPVAVFRNVFASFGIEVTEAEAREPMGQAKIDHIRSMLAMPRISHEWLRKTGAPASEHDVRSLYTNFLDLQKQILAQHSEPIRGVVESVEWFRSIGIKIGSSTGYTRELMDIVLPIAASRGFAPDVCVCSDEVAAGRPAPWLNFRVAELLGVYPMRDILVVDDSIAGIQAGKNAGCIAIAVALTGNAMGLPESELNGLETNERERRLVEIEREFLKSGADLVVQSVEHLAKLLGNNPKEVFSIPCL